MLTLLFDIDGTMVRAGGAGMLAMRQAMKELHGLDEMPEVALHGRTDHGIVTDVYRDLPIDVETAREAFVDRYCQLLSRALRQCNGCVLPNVVELLGNLATRDDVSLGLLTGNAKRASDAKLQHFRLDHYFGYGGFGDDHANRNDVAAVAKQAATEHLQDRFDSSRVWVIGDTVNDITCARSIGAKVIAVETGGGQRAELAAAGADVIYAQLPPIENFLGDIEAAA